MRSFHSQMRYEVLGPDSGQSVDVVMKDGNTKRYNYLGYLPMRQASILPHSSKVKIRVMGFCATPQGDDFTPISEGWFILGRHIETGVFIVTENDKPVSFFAPLIGVKKMT